MDFVIRLLSSCRASVFALSESFLQTWLETPCTVGEILKLGRVLQFYAEQLLFTTCVLSFVCT